jgi:hypothetical protein
MVIISGIGLVILLIIGFIEAIFSSISIWLGGWLVYAFGQLVDDVHTMCYQEGVPAKKRVVAKPQAEALSKSNGAAG